MAKKAFRELLGVVVNASYNGKDFDTCRMHNYYKFNGFKSTGDIFYKLDEKNNFEIVPAVVKENRLRNYEGNVLFYTLDIKGSEDYIPGITPIKSLKTFRYKGARSHYGLFFTTEEEALEWQKKLREGKCFGSLKPGDKFYCISYKYHEKPLELEYKKFTVFSDIDGYIRYQLYIKDRNSICISTSFWEDKSSELADAYLYTYEAKLGHNVKLFLNEKDAVKAIAESAKRREKDATKKYLTKIANHDGKPIAHKDNLGRDLHYGDTVAYIRRTGYNSHPEIRQGVIVGESKTKITVLDKDEKEKGKPVGWRGESVTFDGAGKHSVEKQSVFLIEVATVDKKSSFVFTK